MENIDKLLAKIIPPPTREEREGFTNTKILSELTAEELKIIEGRLINMLNTNDDYLIADTLVYLNSVDSLDTMRFRLGQANTAAERIRWAGFIYEINKDDPEMEQIAFKEFQGFEFIYGIDSIIFDHLIKFNSPRINELIKEFVDHKYFLVAYHAKRVLNLMDSDDN